MKSRGIKGLILAGALSVVSLCSVSAQDSNNYGVSNYGIVANQKYNCKTASIADYKHSQFTNNACEKKELVKDKGIVINMSSRNVLVNENYKHQVGSSVEVCQSLPMAKESRLEESVVKEAYYKDQASM